MDGDTNRTLPAGVRAGSYEHHAPDSGYSGWVEPDVARPGWILFVGGPDGAALLHERRDEDGGVLGLPRVLRPDAEPAADARCRCPGWPLGHDHDGRGALLAHFRHEHLPEHLAAVSRPLGDAARLAAESGDLDEEARAALLAAGRSLARLASDPEGAEGLRRLALALEPWDADAAAELRALAGPAPAPSPLAEALRLVLEAKDCLVRAAVAAAGPGRPAPTSIPGPGVRGGGS